MTTKWFWLTLLNRIVRAVTCPECSAPMEWPEANGVCYGAWCPGCRR